MSWVLKEKQNRQEQWAIQAGVTGARGNREGVINHGELAGEEGEGAARDNIVRAGLVVEPRMRGSVAWAASCRLSGGLNGL